MQQTFLVFSERNIDSIIMPRSPLEGTTKATKLLLVLLCWTVLCSAMPDPNYREHLIKMEQSQQTGGRVLLSKAEQQLGVLLHKLKQQEMESSEFPPAMHFFKAKPLIRNSTLFSLLQKMPKGVVK